MKKLLEFRLQDMAGNRKIFRAESLEQAKKQAREYFRADLVFLADLK